MSKSKALKIAVPYKIFQEVIHKLKTTIAEIMNLQNKGIDFEIKSNASILYWIRDDDDN